MRFTSDELIALYLMEHPEKESGVLTMPIDGTDEQMMTTDVLMHFAHWGSISGHFDYQKALEAITWMEQFNEGIINGEDRRP